jgi:hypothetical protein
LNCVPFPFSSLFIISSFSFSFVPLLTSCFIISSLCPFLYFCVPPYPTFFATLHGLRPESGLAQNYFSDNEDTYLLHRRINPSKILSHHKGILKNAYRHPRLSIQVNTEIRRSSFRYVRHTL